MSAQPQKPMVRVPLSNKLRFDIFRRDLYTCRYCGEKPPKVTLEIDHIIPVSAGGLNEVSNLATACRDCNSGKSATILSDEEVVPDERRAWVLQKVQEIMELDDFGEVAGFYDSWMFGTILLIQEDFTEISGVEWAPHGAVITALVERYDAGIARAAFRATAQGVRSGKVVRGGGGWLKYTWGCARNMVAIPDSEVLTENVKDSE